MCKGQSESGGFSQLRRLQLTQLELLKELDQICRKHQINYSLGYGTLLGAVRHEGFIPWDDDSDVVMLRKDYQKFKKVCMKHADELGFFFQDYQTDPYYLWGYGKIRKKGTTYIREGQEQQKFQNGICVDIFPLDDIPKFVPMQVVHDGICMILRKIEWAKIGKTTEKNKVKRMVYRALSIVPKNTVFRIRNQIIRKMGKSSKQVRCLMFPAPGKHTKGNHNPMNKRYGFQKEWLTELEDREFEGYSFRATKDYDSCLKLLYGDYMKLPPKEKQRGNAEASEIDFD